MKNYLKNFSVMFVMALMFIGIGLSQNGSVANAATIGQQLTQPEAGWTRYDDNNNNISYIGIGWYSGRNTGSLYEMLHANSGAGEVRFNFTGTKLRIIAPSSAANYSNNITINIDDTIINNYSEALNLSGAMTLLYENTSLENKEHTVKISKPADGKYIELDAIDIASTGNLKMYNEKILTYASNIALNKITDNIQVGQTDTLIATTTPSSVTVNWVSSDPSIATVDSNGKVTAIKEGQATITATTTDGSNLSAICTVSVASQTVPTTGITLNKTADSIVVGQTDTLVATTTPSAVGVTWTSSDPSIATVDSTGKITAIKAGTVNITATTTDGLTAICAVTVTNAIDTNGGNNGGTPTGTDGTTNIVNIAHAKGDNTNNAGGEVSIVFNGLPDTTLSVVKTADVKSVYVGDTFTYTIVVTNTGAKIAKAVVINDSAPNHIQFMPNGITTTQGAVDSSSTSSNILVNVGDIPPLGTVTIKIPATVIL